MDAVVVASVRPSHATLRGFDDATVLETGCLTVGGVMKAAKVWMPDLAA